MLKNRTFNARFAQTGFHMDWPLLLGVTVAAWLGLLILYSSEQDFALVERQSLRLGFAFLVMLGISQVPPRVFRMVAPWLYAFGFILLLFVLLMGHISKGGQRWLDLSILRFQPAELMKIAVPLMVARILENEILPPKIRHLWLPVLLIVLPALLIAKQPDLGTALIIASSGFLVIFFAGISWKLILSLVSIFLCKLSFTLDVYAGLSTRTRTHITGSPTRPFGDRVSNYSIENCHRLWWIAWEGLVEWHSVTT